MRKEGLPLKRLLSHESLTAGRGALQARRRLGALRRGRRGQPQRAGRRTPGHRAARRRRGRRGGPRRGRHDHRPPRALARPGAAATPASSSRARPTCGSSSPSAARRCPPDAILGFVTKGGGVSVHRTDCTNAASLRTQPERLLEVEWAPTAPVDVPGQHPGRGARPGPAALRHHDGALRRPREHPQRQPVRPPATGSPRAASPSRWPTPSTSTTSSRPSAPSPASSTPTASPSDHRVREPVAVSREPVRGCAEPSSPMSRHDRLRCVDAGCTPSPRCESTRTRLVRCCRPACRWQPTASERASLPPRLSSWFDEASRRDGRRPDPDRRWRVLVEAGSHRDEVLCSGLPAGAIHRGAHAGARSRRGRRLARPGGRLRQSFALLRSRSTRHGIGVATDLDRGSAAADLHGCGRRLAR